MGQQLLLSVATAGLLLLLSACSGAVRPGQAMAASSAPACAGACLAGQDPYDAGCTADATTTAKASALDASGAPVAVVELRWSGRCGTAWARAVRVAPVSGVLVASVEAVGLSSTFEHATDGEVWTDMVPAPRACATVTGGIRGRDGGLQDVRATSCDDTGAAGLALK
jgi:hypothetical protein